MGNERLIICLRLSRQEPKIIAKISYKHIPGCVQKSLLSSAGRKGAEQTEVVPWQSWRMGACPLLHEFRRTRH